MYRTRFMVSVLGLVLFALPAYAGIILPSATGTAAANSGWPVPPGSGNHSHGTFVNAGEMGVEEERGIVEFNLGAQSPLASVLLLFDNAAFQTCCSPTGVTGGSYLDRRLCIHGQLCRTRSPTSTRRPRSFSGRSRRRG